MMNHGGPEDTETDTDRITLVSVSSVPLWLKS